MSTSIRSDRVSNQRLREAFLREERMGRVDATLVAIRLGWVYDGGRPDSSRVQRNLGLISEVAAGKRYVRRSIRRDRAALLCEAIGLDPVDVGL